MKYDFDAEVNRRNTSSLKWNVGQEVLPMWVADMDFKTAPEITEAVKSIAERGIYGYSVVPDRWYEAVIGWWQSRYGFLMEREWLQFCTGTVAAVSCCVKRLTNIGDNIVVMTPVYNVFFSSVEKHGRRVLESKLRYDKGEYAIDFTDLEEKLSSPLTTMLILCNPHNPIGKIWSREELYKIGELCEAYGVTVLSDEIHCDLTEPPYKYTPFASVSEACKNNSVTCISPSKSFNLAGLQSAAVAVPNRAVRNKVVRGLNFDELAEPNVFAVEAAVAAYEKGESWLEELRVYLSENKSFAAQFINKELPMVSTVKCDATYLLWLDCSRVVCNTAELHRFLRTEAGLYLSKGGDYRGNGNRFLRMNIACRRTVLNEGLKRLKKGISLYEEYLNSMC